MATSASKTKPKTKAKGKAKTKGGIPAGKTLVIVESPSKAKTIEKFLGTRYRVIASVGHVRDLPKSKLGIDKEHDFEPNYINIRGKGDVIREIKKEGEAAGKIYLATDPDREGEAISWHIAYLLGLGEDSANRIVFNEITKDAVIRAAESPRKIDMNLVDAQQARRVLDRLVGYEISPLLWKKIRYGLSAGRVQSAALKLIVDREREIRSFIPEEFWTIALQLKKLAGDKKVFTAKLLQKNGEKITVRSKEESDDIIDTVKKAGCTVTRVEKKERVRKPYAPYTTSTLQQDASSKLGWNTRRVMQVAQRLYEGVDVKGRGTVGLVTYIRTDSVRISAEAEAAAQNYLKENFGPEYAGNTTYTNKKGASQDAHEAIRPSYVEITPESLKSSLDADLYKLYNLIWTRFVASRMASAVYDAVSVDVTSGEYLFRATGSKLKFDGFLAVYSAAPEDEDGKMLPELEEGEALELKDITGEQNFTQPPPRYTESSFVKELEDKDIGRPSTYASIIGTLSDRRYIGKEKKTIYPTELGFTVTEMLEEYFKEIVDAGFTASMEEKLDDIEEKGADWKRTVADFYGILEKELEVADAEIEKLQPKDELTDEICELCGKQMVKKHGRFGEFLACSGYPDCKNTKPIVESTGVACPVCGKDIVARKSKRGRIFYGCSGYPDCRQIYWDKPTAQKCPQCGALMTEKKTKNGTLVCSNKDCRYIM
jgi:DNA topoisomerase-1